MVFLVVLANLKLNAMQVILEMITLLAIPTIIFTSCSSNQQYATNSEKADYLETQKEQYDEPVKLPNTYDEESGKGGGTRHR